MARRGTGFIASRLRFIAALAMRVVMRPSDFIDDEDEDDGDPIDLIARYCDAHGWPHEPIGEDEIVTNVQGSWASYELRAVWRAEDRVLQLLLFPEIKTVDDRRAAVFEALSLINEQLWMGHFEHWSASGMILYRHATLLEEETGLTLAMAETLIQSAIDECERFYPVFQFVLWGGKSPSEAIAAALIETRGEA
jgi:hypothetical protein